jgi:hypothetical protein
MANVDHDDDSDDDPDYRIDIDDDEELMESVRTSAIGGILQSVRMDGRRDCDDFEAYLQRLRVRLIREVNTQMRQLHGMKIQLKIVAEYEKPNIVPQTGGALERARRMAKRRKYEQHERDKKIATIGLTSKLTVIHGVADVHRVIERTLADLRQRHIDAIQLGSGFIMRAIVSTDLLIGRHTPLAGNGVIPLPEFLARKRCIINVQNNDQRCFGYAILASQLRVEIHPERAVQYDQFFTLYGLDAVQYPVQIEDLEAVERQIGIPFNVYTYFDDQGKGRKPMYTSKTGDPQNAVDLLFWENDHVAHYAWIKSFNSFVYDLTKIERSRCFWCKRCFCHFRLETAFRKHLERCRGAEGFKCVHQLPEQGTVLKFKNVKNEERVPFVIYADFESLNVPIVNDNVDVDNSAPTDSDQAQPAHAMDVNDGDGGPNGVDHVEAADVTMTGGDAADDATTVPKDDAVSRRQQKARSRAYQEHKPISIGIKLISSIPGVLDTLPYETYTGADVSEWFLKRLIEYEDMCAKYLFDEARMVMTADDQAAFAAATVCYICDKQFGTTTSARKVRDHDHISGEYRGAAHCSCNLAKRRQRKIPVFFHNFRGFDSHLIVPALGNHKDRKLKVIAQTMEKYMQLQFGDHIVYKDSLQFMSCSLERLAANLLKSGRDGFKHLLHEFAGHSDADVDLLLRKGIYPYDYVDSEARLTETKQLPPREAFFNQLTQEECSVENYEHAKRVWTAFVNGLP